MHISKQNFRCPIPSSDHVLSHACLRIHALNFKVSVPEILLRRMILLGYCSCETKITDSQLTATQVHKQVCWLQVAVKYARRSDVLHATDQLIKQILCLFCFKDK
mmetsp:Transcript_33877/g.114919  ORF Transcript_33877/g.114919 Transcript_33877/m.114919 type:complete len:105 (+) Transcript_33877:822-1136(+)